MILENVFSLSNLVDWFLAHGVKIVFILLAGLVVVKIVKVAIKKWLRGFIVKSLKLAGQAKEIDEEREKTITRVVVSVISLAIWVVVLLTILPELGINIGPLLAGLGVAGLALSFGARGLIQDYLSGLFILLEDHYQIGEEVEVAGVKGKVKDFNLRRTVIEDEEGHFHFIPNAQIKKASNFSRQ